MKHLLKSVCYACALTRILILLSVVSWTFSVSFCASAGALNVQLAPRFNNTPLSLDALAYTNAAGQHISVTRLDFLLSDISLRKPDKTWVENTNWQAYLSVASARTNFSINGIPGANYDRVRFRVGVRPDLNHSDPAQYPADHPLNANLNGLHWGWTGGYVFFALEGRWRPAVAVDSDRRPGVAEPRGYSHHLGNDPMLMMVELPVSLALAQDQTLQLILNLDQIFAPFVIDDENSSTHSRTNDPVALRLRAQVESAFSIQLQPAIAAPKIVQTNSAPLVAPGATPYRFTFARQFPRPSLPLDNPLTDKGVELGRQLFHDPILSVNAKQSCASCHQAHAAFADANRALSVGAEGQLGTRNAMPLFNLAWKRSFFWDGRAESLRQQVLMPIQNPVEMHESLSNVVAKLRVHSAGQSRRGESASPTYPPLFEKAFGSPDITEDRVARALEQFLLTLVSYESRFDRVMQGREKPTDEEQRGFQLFFTEYDPRRGFSGADCFHCHGGPFLTNHGFANNGLDDESCDLGLEEVTGRKYDNARFAVPSLRNVALTAPYMHDGRFKTLDEVIEHYSTGVKRSPTLDPNIAKHPGGGIPLTEADKKALVTFLKMMTDEKYLAAAHDGATAVTGK